MIKLYNNQILKQANTILTDHENLNNYENCVKLFKYANKRINKF